MAKKYKKRVWLNKDKSASTGSIVIYDGESPWEKNCTTRFIEVSSCNNIARLHMCDLDKESDWLYKVKKMAKTLNDYVSFLLCL